MKFIIQLFRIIVGALFIFSGTVKAIDVTGTAIKLQEYFEIFEQKFIFPSFWHFLSEHNITIAVVFVLLEIMLGIYLLLGYKKKVVIPLLLATIIFFTFLTWYSAYFNAVRDCGCFGDFIKLEPWTSFWKDVVLLVMIFVIFLGQKYIQPIFDTKTNISILSLSFIISCFVVWHGLQRLPLVDFRPFAVGDDIRDGLAFEPPKMMKFYELKNIQSQKDTVVNSEDYTTTLWKDTLHYEFVKALPEKDSIINPGKEPKIKNFQIVNKDDEFIEKLVLETPQLMLIVYPDDTEYCSVGEDNIKKLRKKLMKEAPKMEYLTVASHQDMIDEVPSAVMDDATMKQMIRSNPGVLFLKNGVVVGKYHYNTLPEDTQTIIELYQ